MLVVDLFCGLGGFSQAFRDRGHQVIGIDLVKPADLLADLRTSPPLRVQPDLLLAGPPCQEFSRLDMPWLEGQPPDLTLFQAALRAVADLRPRWWVIENVRGAVRCGLLPRSTARIGSRYLWGRFPLILGNFQNCYGKERQHPQVPDRVRERARIPYEISLALCLACEREG